VFNESGNVKPLAREIAAALRSRPSDFSWELVFVDDASTDTTWDEVLAARAADPRVRGLRHAWRRGQSAALWSGLLATSGRLCATLDGDRQNDPADLAWMLDRLQQADFVTGVRTARHDAWLRRASSRVARVARRWVLGVDFQDIGCCMRVFKRAAIDRIFPFDGLHRFLPLLARVHGAVVVEVQVQHRPRVAGVSKYGVWNRLGRGIADLLAMAWYQRRHPGPALLRDTTHSSDAGDRPALP
jgi:glycosyltransferase involved in cell wall biosynthesis